MKKRIFSAFLAAIVFFCMMPIQVRAVDPAYIITNSTPEDSKTANNGYITLDNTSATSGTTVTITIYPVEGYELESLTYTPEEFQISTIADILSTIEGFPASANAQTIPDNAWGNGNGSFVFEAGSAALIFRNPTEPPSWLWISLDTAVEDGENCYTVSTNVYGLIKFNMAGGILTSIEFTHKEGKTERHDGTHTPTLAPQPAPKPELTPVKQTDGTYQFTMPACNVSVKAKFKSTTPEPQGNYLDSLDDMFEAAISSGSTDTIYWNVGDALPNYIMKLLYENPSLSLDFKYTYEGVEHEIYIGPGQATNDDIEWYGPVWLLGKYGEKKDTPAIHGTYTIVKGDTLIKLAAKFNTTVAELMRLNPYIKDKNKIYPGSKLNY